MLNPARGGASMSLAGDVESHTPNPEKSQSRRARWQAANPKALWSHIALASALKRVLTEREPCTVCGKERVDAHHPDYDRSMAVVWVCRRHHSEIHRRERLK